MVYMSPINALRGVFAGCTISQDFRSFVQLSLAAVSNMCNKQESYKNVMLCMMELPRKALQVSVVQSFLMLCCKWYIFITDQFTHFASM